MMGKWCDVGQWWLLSEDSKACSHFCLGVWFAETRTDNLWRAFMTWAFVYRLNNIILWKLMVSCGPWSSLHSAWAVHVVTLIHCIIFFFLISIIISFHISRNGVQTYFPSLVSMVALEFPFLLATVAIFKQDRCWKGRSSWWKGFSAARIMFHSLVVKELSEGKIQKKGTARSLVNKSRSSRSGKMFMMSNVDNGWWMGMFSHNQVCSLLMTIHGIFSFQTKHSQGYQPW